MSAAAAKTGERNRGTRGDFAVGWFAQQVSPLTAVGSLTRGHLWEPAMRLVQLSLAASILVAGGIAAPAVEMTRPFEALEQSRRARIEYDKRQKREAAERQKQEKEQEATRKREEAEQRKREGGEGSARAPTQARCSSQEGAN